MRSRQSWIGRILGMLSFICLCVSAAGEARGAPSQDLPPPLIQMEVGAGVRIRKSVTSFKALKQRRVVFQRYDYSCGAAALATLLQHVYGLPVTEESIVAYIIHTRGPENAIQRYQEKKGFSLLDLKLAAASVGFRSLAYRDMTLFDLVELNTPVILPIRTRAYDHFVVFRGLRGDRVYFADPIAGNLTMKASNFAAAWRGGIGMALKSEEGLLPAGWEPGEDTPGFYVSQDMVRIFGSRDAGFVSRDPRSF